LGIVVDIGFVLFGIIIVPVLAILFLLKWGQAFPRFGRWAERKLGQVSPRLEYLAERLLSEKEQRAEDRDIE
jgi:hypothetical protein